MRKPIAGLLVAALISTAPPTLAAGPSDYPCSTSMLATVRQQLPPLGRDLDPGRLSCNGLAQLFFLLSRSGEYTFPVLQQRIITVFRNEGLTT